MGNPEHVKAVSNGSAAITNRRIINPATILYLEH